MNKSILNIEIQEFIKNNLNSDVNTLLLKGITFEGVEAKAIIEQIEAKKRSEIKLPTWFDTKNIYYPNKLNIEQTSSEITARYKSNLIEGHSIIDLTGGFGVDCLYFSKHFISVTHCELNSTLSEIVNHNYKTLGIDNIATLTIDGIVYLKNIKQHYDWIYIDPSRRHDTKGKVFFLKDCFPNVPEHLDLLFSRSKNIMVKTSPLLDISIGINELKHVKTIHVVAVNNEVKELLWVLERDFDGSIAIKTVNLKKLLNEHFNFTIEQEKSLEAQYSLPLTYLYEPNSAILKSGGFHSISDKLNIFKLHQHSHLYTSKTLIDFPGRTFTIETILPYNIKVLKKIGISKANVTTRNFPESVLQIRKKLKLKDGGDIYLFFTTTVDDKKTVVVCKKL